MTRLLNLGLVALGLVAVALSPARAGWDPELESKAMAAIAEFKGADPTIETFFKDAYGYAVFPNIGKGAVGIGGAYGQGVLFEQGTSIGTVEMTQVTIGFALGGQTFREIIFFKDQAALDAFKDGFEFAAQASAVALQEGAAKSAAYNNGVAIFTATTGGLMFEASIGGQKFTFEPKS